MIYLDNAATSWPKPERMCVKMLEFIKEGYANPGRGGHKMSQNAGKAVFRVREILAELFGIENPLRIAFTQNATQALNIAIHGLLSAGDHVITTAMDHNSVLRPIKTLEKYKGVEATIVDSDNEGNIYPETVLQAIKPNTKLIVCTVASNVTGMYLPFKEIAEIAYLKGIFFLLDAAQGAGNLNIDVKKMHIDLLAFPGHKYFMGPQGTGGLYVGENVQLKPLMQGGTGSNSELVLQPEMMPDLLESGTLNTPGIVGLGESVDFIRKIGIYNIREKKSELVKRLYRQLAVNKKIKLYSSCRCDENSGIVAFNIEGMDSVEVSYILDKKYNIATRAGLHCAPLAHRALGTTKTGIVRMSLGYFNNTSDVDLAAKAVCEIAKNGK